MNPKYSLILFFLGSSLIVGGTKLYEDKKSYKILRSEPIIVESESLIESEVAVEPEAVKVESAPFKVLPPTLDGPEEKTGDHPPIPIVKNSKPITKKYSSTLYRIKPSSIPDTYPHWEYYGSGTLKNHLHTTHGVAYELMAMFISEKDLKKLHSYLHNGYDLFNL